MPYIAPEVITEARRMDLLTYLRAYEPNELVRFSGNTYTTPHSRQLEDFQRQMDVVVKRYRGQFCPRLSRKGQRSFLS